MSSATAHSIQLGSGTERGVRESKWGRVLPEIQGLRAVAVLAVVAYHLWPDRLTGGFVGVDVFFAVSGFLISGHLYRSFEGTGTVNLRKFWTNRIWRLLPASLFVLLVCLVFTIWFTPPSVASEALPQVASAAGYVINWVLAAGAVDYLARDNAPTLVQHYWSLSVEEQFYLLWPLILLGVVVLLGLSRSRANRRRVLLLSVVAIAAASLVWSIVATATQPQRAYFDTFARAWEFALGGALALAMAGSPRWLARVRAHQLTARFSLPTWVGLTLIAGAAFLMDRSTPFPSFWAAVPVVGALLVILGGNPSQSRLLLPTIRTRPVQFIGDISYSFYLWHWPLIVGFAIVAGRPHGWLTGIALGALSVFLAWITKVAIEDPVRAAGRSLRRPWPAFLMLVVGAVLIAVPALGINAQRSHAAELAAAERQSELTDVDSCVGANATLGENECKAPFGLSPGVNPVPPYVDISTDWCLTWFDQDWLSCDFGDLEAEKGTIALVGDSHAAALAVPMGDYYREHGWKVVTFSRFGCPALSSSPIGLARQTPEAEAACATWTERVTREIASRADIDVVLYTSFEASYASPESEGAAVLEPAEIIDTLSRVAASDKEVVVLRDLPVISPGDSFRDVPQCVEQSTDPSRDCSVDLATAFPTAPQTVALDALGSSVRSIDMRDASCDSARCYAVVGDVLVYADYNHVSDSFARSLMPYLAAKLTPGA